MTDKQVSPPSSQLREFSLTCAYAGSPAAVETQAR